MSGLSLGQADDFSTTIERADAQFGSGLFAKPILAQALRETRVGCNRHVPRHRAPDPAEINDVDELPAKLNFGHVLDQDGGPSKYVHTLTPLTRPSRMGAADSAPINGAAFLTCVNVVNALFLRLFSTELAQAFNPRLVATGSRLGRGSRTFSPLAT